MRVAASSDLIVNSMLDRSSTVKALGRKTPRRHVMARRGGTAVIGRAVLEGTAREGAGSGTASLYRWGEVPWAPFAVAARSPGGKIRAGWVADLYLSGNRVAG